MCHNSLIRSNKALGKRKHNLPQVISLFCGAGGLDLGFKEAGFKIAMAIDFEEAAIRTHQANFRTSDSIAADLTVLGPEGVLALAQQRIIKGAKIGIIGGPPCQGFSRANPSANVDDPRNLLPALYIQIIKKLQTYYSVEFVIFENVLGMKDAKHADKYQALIEGLKKLKFLIGEKELCAFDFGVPQSRHRIVVSAMRSGQGYTKVVPRKRSGTKTVKEAIGDLAEPVFFSRVISECDIPLHPNHWTMRPKSRKFKDGIFLGNSSRSFRKLSWDKASPTIAFGNREIYVHPNGNRRLSIFEAMLLQGFPKGFVLKGNLSEQVTQISNAVPPPLARSIANAVKKSLEGK